MSHTVTTVVSVAMTVSFFYEATSMGMLLAAVVGSLIHDHRKGEER